MIAAFSDPAFFNLGLINPACKCCGRHQWKCIVVDSCADPSYCYTCFMRWLAYQKIYGLIQSCPICNLPITKVDWSSTQLSLTSLLRRPLLNLAVPLHQNSEWIEYVKEGQRDRIRIEVHGTRKLEFALGTAEAFKAIQIRRATKTVYKDVEYFMDDIKIFHSQVEEVSYGNILQLYGERVAECLEDLKEELEKFYFLSLEYKDEDSIQRIKTLVSSDLLSPEKISLERLSALFGVLKGAYVVFRDILRESEVQLHGLCEDFVWMSITSYFINNYLFG